MAIKATSLKWVIIPNVDKDSHAQDLGAFSVDVYNQQSRAYLKFLQVVEGEELDRGSEHYTYRLAIKVLDGIETRLYFSEVLQDLSAPSQPPVLNLGSFAPVSDFPRLPTWSDIPDAANDERLHHLALFAVEIYNTENHAVLKLLQVVDGQVLDRGTDHYTYRLMIMVLDSYLVRYFTIEVFQDLSGPDQPPVLNLGGKFRKKREGKRHRKERTWFTRGTELAGLEVSQREADSRRGSNDVAEHLAEDHEPVLGSSRLPGEREGNLSRQGQQNTSTVRTQLSQHQTNVVKSNEAKP
ncbi:hypothetical protein EJ110_NYTH25792 [Nymphaea thermarum]|nr:hypothetical protein EJ110_NYTH25792 [Nymphaea thermarum]